MGKWDKRLSRTSAYINQPTIRMPDKLFPKPKWDESIVQPDLLIALPNG